MFFHKNSKQHCFFFCALKRLFLSISA